MIATLLTAALSCATAWSQTVTGVLLEMGTRKPLGGANVYALPHGIKTVTGTDGSFQFENLPDGEIRWVVNLTGYERLDRADEVNTANAGAPRTLYVKRQSYAVYETTIVGKEHKRDAGTKSLSFAQFSKMPGARGDPVRAVQNLPGVARASAFASQIIVQGSGPTDTRYMIDGHEVPIIFHFGGISSVVVPEALERVDFLAAGYGPEYGRATGGWVGVWTREARKDRWGGYAFLDIFNAGAVLEGPLGDKGGFVAGVRQSYVGFTLSQIFRGNSSLNLTIAPTFTDLTLLANREVTHRDTVKLLALASNDLVEFLLNEPVRQDPSIRGTFRNRSAFFRLIPQLTHRHSSRTVSKWSLGFGKDWSDLDAGVVFRTAQQLQWTGRLDVERKMIADPEFLAWKVVMGIDHRGYANRTQIRLSPTRDAQIDATSGFTGFYWRNEFKLGDTGFTLLPNVRVDYYSRTAERLISPRPQIRFDTDNGLQLRASGGLYHQPPSDQQLDSSLGNPDLKSPYAYHLTAGFEKDFRGGSSNGFVASSDLFWKFLDGQIVGSSAYIERDGALRAEVYNNNGRGRAYGIQTQIKYEHKPWMAAIAYTYARSTRWNVGGTEAPFQYDQPHSLGVLGATQLGDWEIGMRFRYGSGNPFTPVASAVFDADSDSYRSISGATYSERMPDFLQLDIRIDKKWVFNKWIFSAYLDVQNVTNNMNPEALLYSFDYATREMIAPIGILPTFGLKGEF